MATGSRKKSKAAAKKSPASKKTAKKAKPGQARTQATPAAAMGERAVAAMPSEPSSDVEEIYVDGFSSLFFRAGVVKVDCYRISEHDPQTNQELGRLSHRLVMPAVALNDLVRLLQNAMKVERQRTPDKG